MSDIESFPVLDISTFLDRTEGFENDCKRVADLLHRYGILIVRDPRVPHEKNDEFIAMMEQYFEQDEAAKAPDAHPELHYEVRVTTQVSQLLILCSRPGGCHSNSR